MLNAVLLLCLTVGPATAKVDSAQAAFREGRYQEVLPLLEGALADPALPTADRVRAHALAALIHSAFDRPTQAIASYERALEADSTFDVKDTVSPRVRSLFEEARKNHLRRPQPDWVRGSPPPAPPTPWFKSPWVWSAVGVVAVAAGTTVVLAVRARLPTGNVPNGRLQ